MKDVEPFKFRHPAVLNESDLALSLHATQNAADSLWSVPAYIFHMRYVPSGLMAGRVTFRVTDTDWVVNYTGHIGYRVEETFRGQHFAERSCRLLLPFIREHRPEIWITCGPENMASRRTIERLGGRYVETVGVPPDYPLAPGIARQKRRYLLHL